MLNFVGNPPFTAVSAQPGARRPSYFFLCLGFGLGVLLLCSCSCCVSCVGVVFFCSCSLIFLLVLVFDLFLSFVLCCGVLSFRAFRENINCGIMTQLIFRMGSFGFGMARPHAHPRRRPSNPMRVMTWNLWRNKKYRLQHNVAVDILVWCALVRAWAAIYAYGPYEPSYRYIEDHELFRYIGSMKLRPPAPTWVSSCTIPLPGSPV